ncbi:MAG TPA: ferredoxin [Candidatus Binatia bacterium]|nr:ferredoxin [Candidatus Binatia bacterium]
MADKLSKQSENAPGQWYVDISCALCRLCLEEAPNLLTYNHDETADHFSKQPETPEEAAAAQGAMDVCLRSRLGMTDENLRRPRIAATNRYAC